LLPEGGKEEKLQGVHKEKKQREEDKSSARGTVQNKRAATINPRKEEKGRCLKKRLREPKDEQDFQLK